MNKQSLLFSLLLLCPSGFLYSQTAAGIIDSDRMIDWRTAGAPIQQRTTNCATLSAGATAAQINSAISSCPDGQVVKLNAGTYNLNTGIKMKSNVTLRGSGADVTKLNFSGFTNGIGGAGTYAIGVEGNYSAQWWDQAPGPHGANPSNVKSWVGTNGQNGVYKKGATVLNLGSAPTGSPNLSVGDMLFLFQNDDSGPSSNLFISSAGGSSREGSGYTRGTGERQAVKVVGISGNQVTISPGLYMDNWRSSQNPRLHWWGGDARGVGIEDLFIEAGSGSHYTNVSFFQASDSWMSGVGSHETGSRSHALVFLSRNITIQNSYFYDGCSGGCGGSSTAYGIELFAPSAVLAVNNILKDIESPFLFSTGTEGSVIAYNYEIGGATGILSHEEGFLMNLYEGNDSNRVRMDTYHGTQNFLTMFRNRLRGVGSAPIDIWAYNRYVNAIGNVLGTSGQTTRYQCNGESAAQCYQYTSPSTVFRLGYPGGNAATSEAGLSYDSRVASTLMRWGNYDVVNNSVLWQASEVPTGIGAYSNAVPSSQSLPASFFLSGRPSWWATPWGTPAWPAIGPDVTGGNIPNVGGHANKLPAQLCSENLSFSAFNAVKCYGQPASNTPPESPTNLSAVVK